MGGGEWVDGRVTKSGVWITGSRQVVFVDILTDRLSGVAFLTTATTTPAAAIHLN